MTINCELCNKPLLNTEFGYLHLPTDCPEDDGVRVEEHKRSVFEAKYGKPKVNLEKELLKVRKAFRLQVTDNEELTELYINLLDLNNELKASVESITKKLLKEEQICLKIQKQIKLVPKSKLLFQKKKYFQG